MAAQIDTDFASLLLGMGSVPMPTYVKTKISPAKTAAVEIKVPGDITPPITPMNLKIAPQQPLINAGNPAVGTNTNATAMVLIGGKRVDDHEGAPVIPQLNVVQQEPLPQKTVPKVELNAPNPTIMGTAAIPEIAEKVVDYPVVPTLAVEAEVPVIAPVVEAEVPVIAPVVEAEVPVIAPVLAEVETPVVAPVLAEVDELPAVTPIQMNIPQFTIPQLTTVIPTIDDGDDEDDEDDGAYEIYDVTDDEEITDDEDYRNVQ